MSIRLTQLDNGLKIVSDEMSQLETASLGVWVDVGARYEDADINGISHMLEHMAFKGTKRRTAREIAEEMDDVGGHLNAYTSREHTAYYAQVLKEDVPLALDILSDILQNPTFEKEELERERGVIIQEIGQTQDTPDDLVFEYLQEAAYPDQPLGRSILGTTEGVSGFGRDTLANYMGEHYQGSRMVLAAAGKVDHDQIAALAAEAFQGLADGPPSPCAAASYSGGEHREIKDLEQAHVAFAFDGLKFGHEDYYALAVASTVLGGGMSSRLFQEIREVRGLAYSVYSFAASYRDGGLLGIYAGTSEDQAAELVKVIGGEICKLAGDAHEDEVARARAQLKSGLLMSLESSSNRCEQLAKQMLIYGRPLETEELITKVDTVHAEDVRRVLSNLIGAGGLSFSALGPIDGIAHYDKVVGGFGIG